MKITEAQLWSYVDGSCNAETRAAIEQAIRKDETLRSRLEETKRMDQQLATLETEQPSMGFTHSVMSRIAQLPQIELSLLSARQKQWVALFLIAVLILLVLCAIWIVPNSPRAAAGDSMVRDFSDLVNGLSLQVWVIAGSLSLSALALAGLDQYLSKKTDPGAV